MDDEIRKEEQKLVRQVRAQYLSPGYRRRKRLVAKQQKKKEQTLLHQVDPYLKPLAGAAGISMVLGANMLLPGSGFAHNLQVAFLGVVTGGLVWLGHKVAFHILGPMAANKNLAAAALAIVWFGGVTVVVGTAGFSGQTWEVVQAAKYREAGGAMQVLSRQANEVSIAGKQIVPRLVAGDRNANRIAYREEKFGDVSGSPGPGPVTEKLKDISRKFKTLIQAFRKGDRDRKAYADQLAAIAKRFSLTLNQGGVSAENRAELATQYLQAERVSGELAKSMPIAAAKAFVDELRTINIGNYPKSKIDVHGELRLEAGRLAKLLKGMPNAVDPLRPFPSESGPSVGWERPELTWLWAIIMYGIELTAGIVWIACVMDLHDRLAKEDESEDPDDSEEQEASSSVSVDPTDGDDVVLEGADRQKQLEVVAQKFRGS